MNLLEEFFASHGVRSYGAIGYTDEFVMREKSLERRFPHLRVSLVAFAVPYYVNDGGRRNISRYAVPRDYHIFFDGFFSEMRDFFAQRMPEGHIEGFADTSPFNERALALACGVGALGDNGLIINPEYGSYVFLGSIIADFNIEMKEKSAVGTRRCTHCGACRRACPSPGRCLSMITQTKGELSDDDKALIRRCGCAWGCDICQEVCPANADLPNTPEKFFKEGRTPYLTVQTVENMSDEAFAERAYAWKGRKCIIRNLEILGQ